MRVVAIRKTDNVEKTLTLCNSANLSEIVIRYTNVFFFIFCINLLTFTFN